LRRLKIRRRIVEGDVPILADADKRDIDIVLRDDLAEPAAFRLRVLLRVDKMKRRQRKRKLADETLPQIFSKTRAVRDRQADVFIEMKPRHAIPANVRLLHQVR